jgi:DNA-binding MarR family transcriptional regulator
MAPNDQPIGWWLKHLDGLIDASFDDAVGETGLDRREWQILNVIASRAVGRVELANALRPFWKTAPKELERQVEALEARGWLTKDQDRALRVTPDGDVARTEAEGRVQSIRMRLAEGITAEDYERTIETLKTMATNLESTRHVA